jgi:hypothetical protein
VANILIGPNGGTQHLTKSIGQAKSDSLQNFDQHIIVQGAMKLRLLWHRALGAVIQDDGGSMSVHR